MSALGNNTLEVFDLQTNKRIHTINGLDEPQGNTFAPSANKLFVANGGNGTVRIYDGTNYKLQRVLQFSSDADDTRYDKQTDRIYVGYGEGAVAAIDAATDKVLGEIKVQAHPEAYEVEKGSGKIFINVPNAHEIEVADWNTRQVVADWHTDGYAANFPMALDTADHRLFVVTRRPPQLLVLDSDTGKIVAHCAAAGDADDVWYDTHRHRLYVTGGEGFIAVIRQKNADSYEPLERIPTAPGARTSFYSPKLNRLYVAVPHRSSQPAELRIYEVLP